MTGNLQPFTDTGLGRWLWLKVLIGGFVMFFIIDRAAVLTGDINYLPALLAVGTATVPLAFLLFLYSRDSRPHIQPMSLLTSILWGGVLGSVLAGLLEYQTLLHLGTLPTLMIGLIEESTKLVVPAIYIWKYRAYTELDSTVIGAASGAGFATLESMGYGLIALLLSGGNLNATVQTLLTRGLMAPAAHIAWTALASGAFWRLIHGRSTAAQFALTLVGIIILHALWDSNTALGKYQFIVLGLCSLAWLLDRVHRATNTGLASLPSTE